jgi:hypothetical protein
MVIIIYETQGMLQLQKSIAIFCKYQFFLINSLLMNITGNFKMHPWQHVKSLSDRNN